MYKGELGAILKKTIDATRIEVERFMRILFFIGSTLCSDGIKSMKRNSINSTLMSTVGEFEKASVACIAACEITARLFPEFDFTDQILTRIGIRRKDIVGDLAIAAAMVNPSYLSMMALMSHYWN